jgi:hypothetical protein
MAAEINIRHKERVVTRNRIQAHSNNGDGGAQVTKVLLGVQSIAVVIALLALLLATPSAQAADESTANKPAERLYLQLGKIGLDATRVYQVRGASLDRTSIHFSLEDGTIAFTQDVMGHITGAFFEGEGELLLAPPNEVERRSLSVFTGMAILEERFASAYFRFNDDVFTELRPGLRATEDTPAFVDRWNTTAVNLAQSDSMRQLVSFSRLLPINGVTPPNESPNLMGKLPDRFLHARLQGTKLGVFDVFYDSLAPEQVEAGQVRTADNGATYYDVWTSFSPPTGAWLTNLGTSTSAGNPAPREDLVAAQRYTIKTEVQPPKQIHAQARVELDVKEGGTRLLIFELSRFLQVESVKLNGEPVEFIHNPAVEGTQLARRGNDVVAVIMPEPLRSQQKIQLDFVYGGEVLAEAGGGLLYVGARGTWYPNRGMAMADFDLGFDYPPGWTLVATGKPAPALPSEAKGNGLQTSRWVSDRPIPLAGFNLGKYKEATALAGSITVETYASGSVERSFPKAPVQVINPAPTLPLTPLTKPRPQVILPAQMMSPAQNEAIVADAAAKAIQYFAERFGPYPYSRLALTQMPGPESQGWPSLVFLSSYAFLNREEREALHFEPYRIELQQIIPAHETAHQWWGDLVTWSSYRDQWYSEGLANYCALMMLQEKNPAAFREIMEKYRRDLLEKNKDGVAPGQAGPVTLGSRLLSSRFPEGYEAISYGRGAWLFHMLRTMLRDAPTLDTPGKGQRANSEEPFVRALRRLREKYEGRSVSTREIMEVFAEDLPPSLRYEGKPSLDWFLEGWINGTALPKLELKGVKFIPKGSAIIVSGTILQKEAPESLVTSVPIYGVTAAKTPIFLGRVFADGEETAFHLSAPAGTHKILVDPYETILTSPK